MNPEQVIAVCSECKSENPEKYVENNPFYRQGGEIPCKFCSAPLLIMKRKDKESALRQRDRQRGLA